CRGAPRNVEPASGYRVGLYSHQISLASVSMGFRLERCALAFTRRQVISLGRKILSRIEFIPFSIPPRRKRLDALKCVKSTKGVLLKAPHPFGRAWPGSTSVL